MATRSFDPQFMKVGVLTAALQELTPREVRDPDPDRAIEDWLGFAKDLGASYIQISAALHPTETDVPPEAMLDPVTRVVRSRREGEDHAASVEVLAAVDDHGLAGDEVGRGRAEENDGADDVLRDLVALDHPCGESARGGQLDAADAEEPGRAAGAAMVHDRRPIAELRGAGDACRQQADIGPDHVARGQGERRQGFVELRHESLEHRLWEAAGLATPWRISGAGDQHAPLRDQEVGLGAFAAGLNRERMVGQRRAAKDDVPGQRRLEQPWRIRAGERRRVVTGVPGKTGVVYTLDRETGEFLWARPTVFQNVIERIDGATGEAHVDPERVFTRIDQSMLVCPGANGGKNFPAGAYSPRTNTMYMPMQNMCMNATITSGERDPRGVYGFSTEYIAAPDTTNIGAVWAISAEKGTTEWKYEQRAGVMSLAARSVHVVGPRVQRHHEREPAAGAGRPRP